MRSRCVVPPRMPDIPQLAAAIDGRLAEISAQITALVAARAELTARRAASQAAGVAVAAMANQSPRRGLTPPRRQSERSLRRRVAERVEVTRDRGWRTTPAAVDAQPDDNGGAAPVRR